MEIYCLKCKSKTSTLDLIESITKNNKPILKGKCEICGSKKNRFISKSTTGGDIVSSVISKIPIEFHLRTLKGKKYSFCGPNTKLEERLNPDDTPKEWSKPINKVDEVCLKHDLAYRDSDLGKGTRRDADKKMLQDLDNLKDLGFNEKLGKAIIKPIISAKYKLGLGVIKKTRMKKPKNYISL
jgi:hypothetical protein